MTGLILTIIIFPVVGIAVARLVGRVNAFLAGAGAIGFLLFVAGVLRIPLMPAAIALLALSAIAAVSQRRAGFSRPTLDLPTILMLVSAAVLLFISAITPLTDYDGRAFWLMKAKAIAHERSITGPFFQGETTVNSRNEYPLLMPIDAAILMAGELDERHTRWLYVFFAIAFAFELRRRLGPWYGAIFLWLPQIAIDGEGGALSGYSDIALGAFVACAFFEMIDEESPLRFGMWLAFATLTKSEGLPLAALMLVIGIFVFRRRVLPAVALFGTAAASLLIWRAGVERSDELPFATLVFSVPQHWDAFLQSLGVYLEQLIAVRDWGLLWLAIAIAAVLLLVRGERRVVLLAAAVILPMIVLYAAVFAVSGWEIEVLIDNLAPRTLTHLLGPGMFLLWSAAAMPRRSDSV